MSKVDGGSIRLLGTVLVAGVLAWAAPAARADSRAQTFKLANGLEVVVIPDHRVPVTTHAIWYRVGAADDPDGKSGLAHLLEHLMFKSTDKIKSGEFSRIISRLGGRDNALTTHDTTSYFQRVSKRHLREVMQLEADRMTGLRLVDDEVRTERDVVREERRSNIEAAPLSLLSEDMLAQLYQNHPYRRPALGWAHEIVKLEREDAAAFYARHYAPNNAVLVVAGDVTPDEVRTLAQETYGRHPANPAIGARNRPTEPPYRGARRVALEDSRVGSPILLRYYHAPSWHSAGDREAETAAILVRILGGGDTSRLYTRLVVEKRLASHAGAEYQASGRDSGRIALLAVGGDEQPLGPIEQELDRILTEVATRGITADELVRAKLGLEADRTFELDNQRALANRYGEGVALGRSIAHIDGFLARLAAVNAEDVAQMAGELLRPERALTGTLTKAPAPTPQPGQASRGQ